MRQSLSDALSDLELGYRAQTRRSCAAIASASRVMPGGNTRSVLHFSPYPIVIERGVGSTLTDIDGNQYRDFLNDYSAGLYGHSNPTIRGAMLKAIEDGLTLGGISTYEAELARLLVERFQVLELVRFTNSGTEANLLALATARVATGRDGILVIEGGYHGSMANVNAATLRINVPFKFVLGRYNDIDATMAAYEYSGASLAAILVEPMMGASGCIPADPDFLTGMRDLATRTGAVLIFDEVMTSRLGPGGAHTELRIKPDLMTCGKYIGGGGSFGAFGGREDLMRIYDSTKAGAVAHGGTFNNNVITMAAGAAGLREVYTPDAATRFLSVGERFRGELNQIAQDSGIPMQVTGWGSLVNLHFHNRPIRSPADVALSRPEHRVLFHHALLARGFYTSRRGYISLSLANTEDDLHCFKEAFAGVLDQYRHLLCGATA